MLDEAAIRRRARELGVRTDYAEKDYVNSWVLYGIYTTAFGDGLLFKGGTALSKLYFPETWRFSEDLDIARCSMAIQHRLPRQFAKKCDFTPFNFTDNSTIL